MDKKEHSYEIGYGKPPQTSRFAKGQSGNPKGRPKGSKNLASVVLRESRQRVRVNGPGGSRTVTKLEAAIMQIGNKAAQGEFRAARELFSLVQRSEMEVSSEMVPDAFQEADQNVLQNLHRRIQGLNTEQRSFSNSRDSE
jgi:Family of unknown function (DUF5681)